MKRPEQLATSYLTDEAYSQAPPVVNDNDDNGVRKMNSKADREGAPAKRPGRSLPYTIAMAMRRAASAKAFPELTPSDRRVLTAVVQCADARDASVPCWPSRRHLAQETGLSERTVIRRLNALEELGLVAPLGQRRSSTSGRFRNGEIALTREACERLGLAASSPVEKPIPDDAVSPGHIKTTAPKGLQYPKQPVQEHPRAGGRARHIRSPDFVESMNGRVPREFAWMLSQGGIRDTAVFSLMCRARRTGVRLTDVVLQVEPHVRQKRGGQLFGYLAQAINRTGRKRTATRPSAELRQARQGQRARKQSLEAFARDLAGVALAHCEDGRRFEVIPGRVPIFYVTFPDGHRAAAPVDVAFMTAVRGGRIVRLPAP